MYHSFLQSYEWEKLQAAIGRKHWRIFDNLVIQHDLPRGFNYLYAPRITELTDEFLHAVRQIALSEKSLFLKIDPHGSAEDWRLNIGGWQFSRFIQPKKTIVIDIERPDEEILARMHSKTRYNIHLGERHGVGVIKCTTHEISHHLDDFWDLLLQTSERDLFHLHERNYYHKLLTIQGNSFSNRLFFAEYRGNLLAAAIINYYRDTATYLHGASGSFHRDVMAPYVLHWRIMQDAKQHGFKKYDLWGIDEEQWPGVTRFKTGFGGEIVEYPESIDIIFRPMWYRVYHALKRLR